MPRTGAQAGAAARPGRPAAGWAQTSGQGASKQRGRRRKEAGRAAYRRASGRSCSPSADSCTLATAKWSSASALPCPARVVSTLRTLHHLECMRCLSMRAFHAQAQHRLRAAVESRSYS